MKKSNFALDSTFYKKNLRLIMTETVLSNVGVGFAVSIMTIFWNSVGMNQTDIGLVQMYFTISILLFDIPMGYIADRFNRKLINIIGDFGTAISFLIYASANSMLVVTISECLLGLFMAMTNGVDQAFIKLNCEKIDPSGELFKKKNIQAQVARYAALFVTTATGGFIARYSLRVAIGASFIPYFIGGTLAIFIKDDEIKLVQKFKNPLKDMLMAVKDIISNKKTFTYMLVYVSANEITHSQIWVLTPLLLLVGVPIEIVSLGWVLNFAMQTIGGKLSEKLIHLDVSKMYAIPMIIEFAWMIIIIVHVNIVTVWLFALNGLVHGLARANLGTVLQNSAKDEVQTSVMSLASTCCRVLYIPLVAIVNYFGNIQYTYALVCVCFVFIPFFIFNMIMLKKLKD